VLWTATAALGIPLAACATSKTSVAWEEKDEEREQRLREVLAGLFAGYPPATGTGKT
jgi:hypothetical protein